MFIIKDKLSKYYKLPNFINLFAILLPWIICFFYVNPGQLWRNQYSLSARIYKRMWYAASFNKDATWGLSSVPVSGSQRSEKWLKLSWADSILSILFLSCLHPFLYFQCNFYSNRILMNSGYYSIDTSTCIYLIKSLFGFYL